MPNRRKSKRARTTCLVSPVSVVRNAQRHTLRAPHSKQAALVTPIPRPLTQNTPSLPLVLKSDSDSDLPVGTVLDADDEEEVEELVGFDQLQEDPTMVTTTPANQRTGLPAEFNFDFSAPRFRDFAQPTPGGNQAVDRWFDRRQATPYGRPLGRMPAQRHPVPPPPAFTAPSASIDSRNGPSEDDGLATVPQLEMNEVCADEAVDLSDSIGSCTEMPFDDQSEDSGESDSETSCTEMPFDDLLEADIQSDSETSCIEMAFNSDNEGEVASHRPNYPEEKTANHQADSKSVSPPCTARRSVEPRSVRFAGVHSPVSTTPLASRSVRRTPYRSSTSGRKSCSAAPADPVLAPPTTDGRPPTSIASDLAELSTSPAPLIGLTTIPITNNIRTRPFGTPTQRASLIGRSPSQRRVRSKPYDLTVPKPFRFRAATGASRALRTLRRQKETVATQSIATTGLPLAEQAKLVERLTRRPLATTAPGSAEPFIPLAERVQALLRTPDRLKARLPSPRPAPSSAVPPRSPLLRTKQRCQGTAQAPVLSHDDREYEAFVRTPKYKAHPVNHHILHASPRLPAVPKPTLTVPVSPAIRKPRPPKPRSPSPARIPKANPIRLPDAPFIPARPHTHTSPRPFKFRVDDVGRKLQERVMTKVAEERQREEAARHFRARPLPDHDTPRPASALGRAEERRPLTRPIGLRLLTDARGAAYQARLRAQLQRKRRDQLRRAQFRARPVPQLDCTFIPQPSTHPLTEIVGVRLHTAERHETRAVFDDYLRDREHQKELALERQRQAEEARALAMEKELRRRMVHRAQPVPEYPQPTPPRPSERPLTVPESPMIGGKRKRLEIEAHISMGAGHDADSAARPIAKIKRARARA